MYTNLCQFVLPLHIQTFKVYYHISISNSLKKISAAPYYDSKVCSNSIRFISFIFKEFCLNFIL